MREHFVKLFFYIWLIYRVTFYRNFSLYDECFQKKVTFYFPGKIFFFLFINKYLVPFKVISRRYNTPVPALVFWKDLKLFQRCALYLLNRSKTSSFHASFQFWNQKEVAGSQVRWIWCLRHDYDVVSRQKFTNKQWCVCCLSK